MNFIFNLLSSNVMEHVVPILICLLIVVIGFTVIGVAAYKQNQANQRKAEDELRQIHNDREVAKNNPQENSVPQQEPVIQQAPAAPQQAPAPRQVPAAQAEPKKGGGFLKFLGIVFLIILIVGGIVFVAKCAINKASDGEFNSDGNPVLLNRAATLNDFTLTESVEATITNLKESYILVPNVDIKNLEITFKYYDSSNNLIATKTKSVGNVTKSSEYTVSIEHSLTEIFKISKVSHYVTGGTVSYFK